VHRRWTNPALLFGAALEEADLRDFLLVVRVLFIDCLVGEGYVRWFWCSHPMAGSTAHQASFSFGCNHGATAGAKCSHCFLSPLLLVLPCSMNW
jgi:hypothetical protein